jgi:rhodanese-related sulfurtransferase
MAAPEELTPAEFCRRWPDAESREEVVLLDVREPDELARARLPEAVHIPMRQVPARIDEIPPEKTVVVMCHSGGRSARVAQFLADSGFERVFNLRGGIDAWSTEVDGEIPRY